MFGLVMSPAFPDHKDNLLSPACAVRGWIRGSIQKTQTLPGLITGSCSGPDMVLAHDFALCVLTCSFFSVFLLFSVEHLYLSSFSLCFLYRWSDSEYHRFLHQQQGKCQVRRR